MKPANIMIDAYGNPGLVDFGLAAMPQPGQDISVTMEALTPAYAPKEVLYQRPPSEYGDVFSLAATLYALLDGKPPRWPDEGTPSLPEIFELQRKPVERLPDVHPQLMDVLLGALADDAERAPERRRVPRPADRRSTSPTPSEPPPSAPPPPPPAPPDPTGDRRRRLPLLDRVDRRAAGRGRRRRAWRSRTCDNRAAVNPPVRPPRHRAARRPSTEPAPSPSRARRRPDRSPAAAGFVDCSSLLGAGAYCPTEPECWFQYISNNDFPAVANPISCNDSASRTRPSRPAGVKYPIRLQSQLEADPFVERLCRLCTRCARSSSASGCEDDWGVEPYPPQDRSGRRLLPVPGHHR